MMKNILFFASILIATNSTAQEIQAPIYIPSCIQQDYIGIKDEGLGRAIVTYSNSIESCSVPVNWVFTSSNGISVRIIITIGTEDQPYETINIYPLNEFMMSFPPTGEVLDGETQRFIITGGIS